MLPFGKYHWLKANIIYCLLILTILSSCGSDEDIPDVSGIEVDVELIRFEDKLFNIPHDDFRSGFEEVLTQYPTLTELYLGFYLDFFLLDEITESDAFQGMNYGIDVEKFKMDTLVYGSGDTMFIYLDKLNYLMLNDPNLQQLYKDTRERLAGLELENEIKEAFRFYKYYFPSVPLPDTVFTLVAPFRQQNNFRYQNIMGIELNMYLGRDYHFYYSLPDLSQRTYLLKRFEKEHIIPDLVETMIKPMVEFDDEEIQLYYKMITNGKMYYALSKCLPNTPDSLLIKYTADQMAWIEHNEGEVFAFLFDQDLLYSSETDKTRKYMEEGPFTNTIDPRCPANVGSFFGWRIVAKYCEEENVEDLLKLLQNPDHQEIMNRSGYKPRRN